MSDAQTLRTGDAGDWRDMLSVDPDGLYGRGGFYDGEVTLAHLQDFARPHAGAGAVEIVAELYPALAVSRPMPAHLDGPDDHFLQQVTGSFEYLNGFFSVAAGSVLVRLPKAAIYDNVVFVVRNGELIPLYEMLRAPDRPVKGKEMAARAGRATGSARIEPDGSAFLFVGSVGSFNYGHWLVDDFPTLKAVGLIDGQAPVTALMSSYGDRIDAVRGEGAALGGSEGRPLVPRFLPTDTLFFVDDLYFTSPVSYHPILKHPQALSHIVGMCDQRCGVPVPDGPESARRKLFVNRVADSARRIGNGEAVRDLLLAEGYEEILPERLSFQEQRRVFREASHVVGLMGAAMTNTLFCPPDSRLLYLAPSGWSEPFYWDLAAMRGHSYNTLFGTVTEPCEHIHQCGFDVDIERLRAWLG